MGDHLGSIHFVLFFLVWLWFAEILGKLAGILGKKSPQLQAWANNEGNGQITEVKQG